MRNKLLACGLESYDDAPIENRETITVDVTDEPTSTPPQPVDLSGELDRIHAISKDLDEVSSGLGYTVANMALESLYGLEDAGPTGVLKRFIQMVGDYIKRLYNFIREYGRKLINANRYNVRDASARAKRATRELSTVRLRKFAVEGNAIPLLMIDGRLPATSIDCTRSFTDFQKNVMLPLNNWMRRSVDVTVRVETLLKRVFSEKSILDVSLDTIDELERVTCARLPGKWDKRAINDGHGGTLPICSSPKLAYGGVRFALSGDETTSLPRLMNAPTIPDFLQTAKDMAIRASKRNGTPLTPPTEEAMVTGDVVAEFAKIGTAFADAQVETVGLYEHILAVADIANKGYTTTFTFIKTDDKEASARGSRANAAVNAAMAYISSLLTAVCGYNSYLTDIRNAIAVIVDGVLDAKTA